MRDIKTNPLDNLGYFMEWGGRGWENLFAFAIEQFLRSSLNGKQILDVGSRYGKISSFFALLGGTVTGIDINLASISIANDEAAKWNVQEKTRFIYYDGNLDILQDEMFDVRIVKRNWIPPIFLICGYKRKK